MTVRRSAADVVKGIMHPEPRQTWHARMLGRARAHQDRIFEEGVNHLPIARRVDRRIQLQDGRWLDEFISCSYLGLETDPRLATAAKQAIDRFGVQFASARTRARPQIFVELEASLSRIFAGATVTFNSVSAAHLAVLPLIGSGALPSFPVRSRGVTWLLDRTAHASIQNLRALMEQSGPVERVDITDQALVASRFEAAVAGGSTPISVSDSIGSMGGVAPICQLFTLAERSGGYVYLDDAHGTSVHGSHGGGYVLDQLGERFHPRLILLSSLSKGFGSCGGAVTVQREEDAEALRRFAIPYLFGGPPSLPAIAAALASASIHLSGEITGLQGRLWDNIARFDRAMGPRACNHGTRSPVRAVRVGDENLTIQRAKTLLQRGISVTAALYPTVARGQGLLRVALSASHQAEQIDRLADELRAVCDG